MCCGSNVFIQQLQTLGQSIYDFTIPTHMLPEVYIGLAEYPVTHPSGEPVFSPHANCINIWRCASVVYMICLLRLRVNSARPWMISSMWCYYDRGLEYYLLYCSSGDIDARQPSVYMTVGPRPILLLLAGSLPAGLYAAGLLLYS